MDNIQYTEKIRCVGNQLINDYIKFGHVRAGINGPYNDPETEVRNLAHLLVIVSVECRKYNRPELKKVIKKMADDLLNMRSADGTYKMRYKEGKDFCNGVIGHAWLVEGLLYAYYCLEEEYLINEMERILLMHKFQPKLGLWARPLKDNTDKSIDFTFNHQLWFAATVAEFLKVKKNTQIKSELKRYCEKLPYNMKINRKGRITHSIYSRIGLKQSLKMFIKNKKNIFFEKIGKPSLMYKEVGYHVFNLMAFARLFKADKDNFFFKTKKFFDSLDYIKDKKYQELLSAANIEMDGSTFSSSLTDEEKSVNIYGYPYNVPGFELIYCQQVFAETIDTESVNKIIQKQFDTTWDDIEKRFVKKCCDKVTVNYRSYEYYRYLDLKK